MVLLRESGGDSEISPRKMSFSAPFAEVGLLGRASFCLDPLVMV